MNRRSWLRTTTCAVQGPLKSSILPSKLAQKLTQWKKGTQAGLSNLLKRLVETKGLEPSTS